MSRGRWVTLLSVLGALALVVAACAPAATPTPTATPTPPPGIATPTPAPGVATPTPTGETTPTPTPVVAEAPQYGGEFRQASGAEITGFDSHRNTSGGFLSSTALIFNQLVRFDPTKETVKWEDLQGDLAERWEMSADGLVYTFYLRKGVKYHDGKPFTSADVVYSLTKLADPKRSTHASKIAAFNRAEAIDEHTVKVYLNFPQTSFLPMLGAGFFHMQPKHLAEVNYRTTAFAIGTGPFKLKSTSPGVEALFEKNPDYFLKGLPYVDRIRFYGLTQATVIGPFVSKQTDYWQGVISEDNKVQLDMLLSGYHYRYMASFTWRGVYFNWEREGPWQDVRVRRAMVLTFDFPGSIIAATGGPEQQQLGAAFPPPPISPWGLTGEETAKRWGIDRPMEERLAQAKRLMAEAGYPNGFKGTFLTRSPGQTYITVTLFVADLWKRYLNIDLTVRGLASAPFFVERDAKNWDILWEGIAYSLGDPDEILAQTYRTGSPDNFSRYTNPYVDDLADKILRESDIEKRQALAYAAQRAIIDDVATIVPAWHAYGYLWQDWVKGMVIQPGYTRQSLLPYWWLDRNHPQYPRGR